jgi:prevent-host-death family protein
MKTVTIHEAKTNLTRLIEKGCRGEEIIIARSPEPVARLVPIAGRKGRRKLGILKGKLRVGPEFFEPLRPKNEHAGSEIVRLLLDTHTLRWCFNAAPSLSSRARRLIEDGGNEILVSAASA